MTVILGVCVLDGKYRNDLGYGNAACLYVL